MKRTSLGGSILPSLAVGVLVVVSQACTTGPGAPVSVSPTVTLGDVPSSGLPSSTPATQPSVVAIQPLADSGTIFPGRYKTKLDPPMTITITDVVDLDCAPGYRCRGDIDVNLPQWVGFEFGNVHGSELDISRLDKVVDPAHPVTTITPPDDLAAWFTALHGVSVIHGPTAVTIGGLTATQLDVRTGSEDVSFGPTGLADPPEFGMPKDRLARVLLLWVAGRAIVIAEGLGPDNTVGDFPAAVLGLQAVVDSIAWE